MEYGTIREICEKEVLTVTETAEMLGVSRQWIHELIKDGTYKPFRYVKYATQRGEIPLLIRSEVLAIEKRKLEEKKDFWENHITTSLAKKIMKKRLPDFIKDLDSGLIKKYAYIKGFRGNGEYVNLKEFTEYAKGYGINLDRLITTKTIEYRLFESGIFIKLYMFLEKYGIKPVYDLTKDKRYALFNREEIENAIGKELSGKDMSH